MSNLSGFVKRLRDIMRNDAGINGDAQRIEQIAWMLFLKVYDAKEQDWEFDEEGYVSIIPEACRWQNWAVDDKSGAAPTGDQRGRHIPLVLVAAAVALDADGDSAMQRRGAERRQVLGILLQVKHRHGDFTSLYVKSYLMESVLLRRGIIG